MPIYFQKPENALKRAKEFIDVGKKQPALDALYDVIKSKKHRTWQKIHEPIMTMYLTLCVELRKSHTAKEGLYQYKIICQQMNVKSLEDVVKQYLDMAEEKTEEARKESEEEAKKVQGEVMVVDDLDNITTPESLLLSAVSGEDTQARTDRVMLTPWVKFLWESYRQCLDLLRNNTKVEQLYHIIAQNAFKFCAKYSRKTEFRKLCDNLRSHLGLVQKHHNQQTAINLNNETSQQLNMETRLMQLETAISMELWQEAYKAVEDIHSLMGLSKKPPKPQMMANYYQKLGLVFWKSGNALFHACALHRLLQLSREQRKNLTPEETQRMASRVLLATLTIPISPPRNDIGNMLDMGNTAMENQRKLANLLGLQNPPTRVQLIKDLVKYNVVQFVHPQLANLFNYMEVQFHPLKLCNRVVEIFDYLREGNEADFLQYVPFLETNAIVRLLKQVCQVYQTIQFKRLCTLVSFATPFQLEKIIVDTARNGDVSVRMDHGTQSLSFGKDMSVSTTESSEGPTLQPMPAEQIRNQLTEMSSALHKSLQLIKHQDIKADLLDQKQKIIRNYVRSCRKEHELILARRHTIEDRKEKLESLSNQREKQEQEAFEEQQKKQRTAEEQRLKREAEERALKKKKDELKEIQKKQAQQRLDNLKQSALGKKVIEKLNKEELESLDVDDIYAKQIEQLEAEKKELQNRLKTQEKKVDYFERAKREVEIPFLKEQYAESQVKDRELWEQQEEQRITLIQEEHRQAEESWTRLSRMAKDRDEFLGKLKQARASVYKEKLKKFEEMLSEERKVRLMERKQHRKEERRAKWLKEKEEEEQRLRDEEAKRKRELEREEQEKEEEEYRKKLAKLQEQDQIRRAREKEIEEREERERMSMGNRRYDPPSQGDDKPWKRGEADAEDSNRNMAWRPKQREGGGGWRERVKAKEDSWKGENYDEESESRSSWRRDGDDHQRDGEPPRRDEHDRDERGGRRDEDDGGSWRRGGEPPERYGGRDDGPSRGGGWRDRPRDYGPRGGDRYEDRGPRGGDRYDDRGPRGGDRYDDRGPRGGGRYDDRGPRGGDRYDDRGPRGGDRYDDRGPRRIPMRDDRGPDDRGSRDVWRRRDDPPPRGDGFRSDRGPPRDDHGPPPREDRDRWRRSDGPRDGPRDEWKRDRYNRDEPPAEKGPWRRGGAREPLDPPRDKWRGRDEGPPLEKKRVDDNGGQDDDGWTTVSR
ncbi:eukaryotic translation initiation factor 3 subunit A-like [Anneissia japonica]|uniref:eukaryotic translation initiation factor 3 subunit A-like n=1 Tax=Anneissia japonica TaxID=1529436 RepID=UPI001425943F|nr:eukaryotic translation initiation factor 3 subunit A-like [Anneissia japonica]